MVLTEPIDVKNLRRRLELRADIDPMRPVIPEVVSREGFHRHRIAAQNADLPGNGGGGFGCDARTQQDAVQPISRLKYQRSERPAASAEYDGGYGHTAGSVGHLRVGGI